MGRRWFGQILAALTSLAVASCAPAPVPPKPEVPAASPDYGVHTFVWNQPATTERDLQLVKGAAFHWQKSLFQWREIEPTTKGQFNWTEADRVVRASSAAGIKIIARLDFEPMWARKDQAHNGPPDNYQDYWDFVTALVTRYKAGSSIGRVQAIEVWNEPNLDREWGNQPISASSAADYVRLLGAADDLEFLKWMYAAGLKGKFDALGAHANAQAPEVAAPLGSLKDFPHPSFYFRRVEQLRQSMVDNLDSAKQLWLVEWGWTSDKVHPAYAWFAVTEDKKADNIVQAFTFARENWSPWIGVMSLWTLCDPTWDENREEYWWAIDNPDGSPRPAYTRVRDARRSGALPG